MKFEYETGRLSLKILQGSTENARMVLDFFVRNKDTFESHEAMRPENFYTLEYQKTLLNCEFNLCLKLTNIRFWVFLKEQPDRIIGTVSFRDIVRSIFDTCETGYKFDPDYWHRGFAYEALSCGISAMFEDLQLHRIEAYVMPDNIPSIRLLTRLCFQQEGLCRQSIRIQGIWQDHLQFALIRSDFSPL